MQFAKNSKKRDDATNVTR